MDAEEVRNKVLLNPQLLEQARMMGRQGVLQSMVLHDINREEAMAIARSNVLGKRSTDTDTSTPEKRQKQ
jgi:hypothetical protein